MVHMQWKNDLVAGSDRFFSALGRAYWTDADPRGFAEGILALVRREEKYAKGHLEGWYGIINNYETELLSTYITVPGPKKCRVYMNSDPKKCDKLREMIRTKEFGR